MESIMSKENQILNVAVLKALFKNRKIIILTFIVSIILSVIISLCSPMWFRAYTTIMPSIDEGDMSSFSSMISDLSMQALGLGSTADEGDLFTIAILDSRTIMEAAATEFDLQTRYHKKNMEKTVKELRKHIAVNYDDEGTISLSAEAKTPWFSLFNNTKKNEARLLAMKMANFFITELDKINIRMRTERARNFRFFIERRYEQNLNDLKDAEWALKEYQEKHGIVYLPDQTEATIRAAAELQATIVAKEVELETLKQSVGNSHSEIIKVRSELNALEKKLNEFRTGIRDDIGQDTLNTLFLPFQDVPDLGMKYLRLYRNVLLQEKLLEFLLPQYEQAKIKEAKDTPSLQILDKAILPIHKHRPKRAIIVVFYGFLGILLSSMYVLVKPTLISLYQEIKE